jgi:GPH family glycoside/pentoside/hexuronide:cation symporter
MGFIFGSIISLAFIVALFGCREKKELSSVKPLGFLEALSATLKNRSFLTFVISNLFIQYTFMMVLAVIPFYAKYVLGVGPKWTSAILLSAFLFEMPMLFVWGHLATRFGAKRVYMVAIAAFAVFLLPFFFLKAAPFAGAASALIGAALGGVIVLSDVLISDVIDEDEIRTGRRREGMYFGINAFVTRFAIALEAASIGGIFILTGYDANVLVQNGAFLTGLRFLIAGLPMLSMIAAFVIMIYYPLEGKYLENIHKKSEIRNKPSPSFPLP